MHPRLIFLIKREYHSSIGESHLNSCSKPFSTTSHAIYGFMSRCEKGMPGATRAMRRWNEALKAMQTSGKESAILR